MVTRPAPINNGTRGRGRNAWTYEQRVCLHLLRNHERQLSRDDRALVFNSIYKDHQTACGVPPPGLAGSAIDCQYSERRYTEKSSWQATWGDVLYPPNTAVDRALRERLLAEIASALGHNDGETIDVAVDNRQMTPPATIPRPQHRNRLSDRMTPAEHPYARVYATPNTSSRKRTVLALKTTPIEGNIVRGEDSINDNEDDHEYVPRSKRSKARSPTVCVPPSPFNLDALVRQSQRTVATPSKRNRYRSGPREGATMLLQRLSGGPIWLTPTEYSEAMEPLEDVSEEDAHPTPPALLFRCWSLKSHGINSNEGFVSGRFANNLVEPRGPPDSKNVEHNDFGHHLNNGGNDQQAPPSPFISTSNLLVWVIRMALKQGDRDCYISVIDTSKMDPKSIFYVPPFYRQLKKKKVFFKGGFSYQGSHEHLIWHKIPSAAVIKTFSVSDLTALSESSRGIRRVLRLDQISTTKSGATNIIKQLRQSGVQINSCIANSIGAIALFLGLDHSCSFAQLSRAVYEIAQGLALQANGESQDSVGAFIKAFIDASESYINIEDQLKLKQAFLCGIEYSCGDLNLHLKGAKERRVMKSRASKRGLADVGSIITDDLNRARRSVALFSREQERLQLRPAERLALENREIVMANDDAMEEEDEDEVANGLGQFRP